MDTVTSAIVSGAVYDIFKKGISFTKEKIKEQLSAFITNDDCVEIIAKKLAAMDLNDDMSEKAIQRKVEDDTDILTALDNLSRNDVAKINQHHYGSGDNVGGNKIINQGK
ncbi:GapS6a family protein [Pectobacterium polaris]|uniref:GapS6a family protein n=1 Tax=Pectobacterium polaris TaxID=2042057 RepID=UPI00240564B5|nr:hypothetical protein [Pectobacterium polaris]MDG0801448.1 hypothetical protein [Pectobacterium polaris]